jgi:hypothetical protein
MSRSTLPQQKSGVMVVVLPEATTLSGPVHQVASLINTLKETGREDSPSVSSHWSELMHSIGTPCSQLSPGPSPRTYKALPKPTSIRATIFVCTFAAATAFTVSGAAAGLVSAASATDLIVGTVAAAFVGTTGGTGLAAGAEVSGTAAGVALAVVLFFLVALVALVAGAGDFVFELVFFIAVLVGLESG